MAQRKLHTTHQQKTDSGRNRDAQKQRGEMVAAIDLKRIAKGASETPGISSCDKDREQGRSIAAFVTFVRKKKAHYALWRVVNIVLFVIGAGIVVYVLLAQRGIIASSSNVPMMVLGAGFIVLILATFIEVNYLQPIRKMPKSIEQKDLSPKEMKHLIEQQRAFEKEMSQGKRNYKKGN
jgi:hypothetical protein